MLSPCCASHRVSLLVVLSVFPDTATTEIYTLSLHDALPISRPRDDSVCRARPRRAGPRPARRRPGRAAAQAAAARRGAPRSEEHTSELQSLTNLVCRLLREKKKKQNPARIT